jgi:hypothetical protein
MRAHEPGIEVLDSVAARSARRTGNALRRDDYPFLRHDFLLGLEQRTAPPPRPAGSRHLRLRDRGRTLAILPAWPEAIPTANTFSTGPGPTPGGAWAWPTTRSCSPPSPSPRPRGRGCSTTPRSTGGPLGAAASRCRRCRSGWGAPPGTCCFPTQQDRSAGRAGPAHPAPGAVPLVQPRLPGLRRLPRALRQPQAQGPAPGATAGRGAGPDPEHSSTAMAS